MSVPYLPDAADRAAAWNGVVAWYVAGVVALFAVAVMAWLIERRGHVMSPVARNATATASVLLVVGWAAFGYVTLYAYHVSRRVLPSDPFVGTDAHLLATAVVVGGGVVLVPLLWLAARSRRTWKGHL